MSPAATIVTFSRGRFGGGGVGPRVGPGGSTRASAAGVEVAVRLDERLGDGLAENDGSAVTPRIDAGDADGEDEAKDDGDATDEGDAAGVGVSPALLPQAQTATARRHREAIRSDLCRCRRFGRPVGIWSSHRALCRCGRGG
jgi:hypothetical protein